MKFLEAYLLDSIVFDYLQWDPPSLDRVSEDMVDEYFSPLSVSEPELELPTKQREAFS